MATTKKPAAPKAPAKPAKPAIKKPSISAAHKADIQAITGKMYQLSQQYGYCEVFDDAVAELNKKLNHPIVRPMERFRTALSFEIKFDSDNIAPPNSWGEAQLTATQQDAIEKVVLKALQGLPGTYQVDSVDCDRSCYSEGR